MKIPKNILENKGIAYVERFQYNELSRASKNGKRHYETPDGRSVPSVTTVLSATKDMTQLNAWRKRIGVEKAKQITTESANIGTVMHSSLEKHVKGIDRKPGTNLIHQKAHAMANVIIDNGLTDVSEVWGSEVSLYYPELYAGTTDLVGVYKGAPAIMDFKQSRKLKKKEWIDWLLGNLVERKEECWTFEPWILNAFENEEIYEVYMDGRADFNMQSI